MAQARETARRGVSVALLVARFASFTGRIMSRDAWMREHEWFNVVVDHPRRGECLAVYSLPVYDASAVANFAVDRGFRVETDLWDAVVWDAMVSPRVFVGCQLAWMDAGPQ